MFQIIPFNAPTWLAQIAPIELIDRLEIGPGSPTPLFWVFALALALSVVIGVGLWWRRRRRSPELERAFRGMARRLKLSKRRRQLVGQLAEAGRVPAVVLLLSEYAFDQATIALEPVLAHASVPHSARAKAPDRPTMLSDAALASLRQTLFGDR